MSSRFLKKIFLGATVRRVGFIRGFGYLKGMNPNIVGIDRLAALENGASLRGFWVGKVVDDGEKDAQGRITARIEALFGDAKTGVPDSDLPKLQMMPSCGLYVRPQRGDFVTVAFQGSSYEGFYMGHTVSAKSKVFDANLGAEFVINFHKSRIKGKYDGSVFEIDVNDGKAKMELTGEGDVKITGDGDMAIESGGKMDIKSTGSMTVDSGGSLDIKSTGNATISPTGTLKVTKNAVIPSPSGGVFCGLPKCIMIPGIDHQGQIAQ